MKKIIAILLVLFSGSVFASAVAPEPRNEDWWKNRNAKFNAIAEGGNVDILFIGDSITEGWEGSGKKVWEKEFAPMKAVEFGIGGDRTENVIWRLDNGNLGGKMNPKAIVLMIGTNNTGHRKQKAEETAADIKTILEKLTKHYPRSHIILLGIFPRGEKADDPLRKINDEINAIISKIEMPKVHYMDISKSFTNKDGSLSKDIMPDYLHLSEKGYQIWADQIMPAVKKYAK